MPIFKFCSIALINLLFILTTFNSFSQTKYIHPSTLGIHFILNDFSNKNPLGKASNMDAGISITYLKGINSRLDYQVSISGSFPDSVSKAVHSNDKFLFLQTDFLLRARLLNKASWIQPFVITGLGVCTFNSSFGSYFSIGPGLEFNYKDIYFISSFQYRPSLSGKLSNNYFYSIGIAGLIGKPKMTAKPVPASIIQKPIASDRDGDGLLDSVDICPDIPGLAIFQGCPDGDADGIEDRIDQCPSIFGYEKYKGCPIPDLDKDGINDEEDQCISIQGTIKYHGCPVPDTDQDGINDELDSCISVHGVIENKGCPLVNKEVKEKIDLAAKNILFKTGSHILESRSYSSLKEVLTILKQNPSIILIIEGHTDNVGTEAANQLLSENRARTVEEYFIKQGIEKTRLRAVGYGQQQPIDTNQTIKGRSNNRRVVFNF